MISLYLDELSTTKEIINAAEALSIKKIPLRKVKGKSLYNLSTSKLEEIDKDLRSAKIKVNIIDINVKYDLYKVIDTEKIFTICEIFKCRNVLLKLPMFSHFKVEKDQLIKVLNGLIDEFKKAKINLSFHINYQMNSAYMAYIIREINNINFSFNPGECYNNDKSITTYYRLLRNKITNVILYDLDENKKPALLGYGKALILDVIDKLILDKYRGDIYYDFNLSKYVESKNEPKRGFFSRLFKRKKRETHQKMDEILRLDEDEKVDLISLLSSQLQLINMYKKI